jgi:hypothetical protein
MKNFAMQLTGETLSTLDLPFPDEIAPFREDLNYVLESLITLDMYMEKVHGHVDELSSRHLEDLVVGIGAYVGEIIVRVSRGRYRWSSFEAYAQAFPESRERLGREPDINTFAFCVREDGKMYMPLNKVSRFIFEGPQHSLEFFVRKILDDLHAS